MIAKSPFDLIFGDLFFEMQGVLPQTPVYVKLEGFNVGRSIKLKSALAIIEDFEQRGILHPQSKIIESSSGNFGLALSIVCSVKGYSFTCVSDPNINPYTHRLIETYGGQVIIVDQRDANGGYLNTRIDLIKRRLAEDRHLIWINQYANPLNKGAHSRWTAPEIHRAFPELDYLFIPAGTTGTLMGCAEYFREHSPKTKLIAVDTQGSVTFGHAAGARHIPGVGTSRRPELFDPHYIDDVVMVPEQETVLMCRRVLKHHGLLVGGSTGTALCGIEHYSAAIPVGATVVTISPDFGEHYVDTVYDDDWVLDHYPLLAEQIENTEHIPPSLAALFPPRSFAEGQVL